MYGIDLRKLRYFVAVAEELHFRRAAEKLNMSQPPLSQHIQRLEDEIGAKLFVRRTNKQVRLTPVGEKLLAGVRLALQQAERATLDAKRTASGELGLLRVGYTREFQYGFFPDMVARYITTHPDVLLELTAEFSWSLLQKIYNEEVDIAFLHRAPLITPDGLEILSLPPAPLVAVLNEHHPLAGAEQVTWRDLIDTPYLLPKTVPAITEDGWRAAFFEMAGYVPKVITHVSTSEMTARMVAKGVGWALGSHGSFDPNEPGIALVKLTEPTSELTRIAVWKADPYQPALAHFVRALSEELSNDQLAP